MKRYIFGLSVVSVALMLIMIDRFLFLSNLTIVNRNLIFGQIGNNMLGVIISVIALLLIMSLSLFSRFNKIGLSFIFIGSIVNISERLVFGGVIDYIHFPYFSTFNLADIFVLLGICLVLSALLKDKTSSRDIAT